MTNTPRLIVLTILTSGTLAHFKRLDSILNQRNRAVRVSRVWLYHPGARFKGVGLNSSDITRSS